MLNIITERVVTVPIVNAHSFEVRKTMMDAYEREMPAKGKPWDTYFLNEGGGGRNLRLAFLFVRLFE